VVLPAQSLWSRSATTDVSFGYKDNLLLSSADEEGSAFARGSVSLLLLRASTEPFQFSFFSQADGSYYFSGTTVDHDAKAWVQADFGYRLGDNVKLSLPVTGSYFDQVFDVSDTDVERLVASLKVVSLMVAPSARWQFHPSWWTEAQALGDERRYDDESNDQQVGAGTIRLGWSPARRVDLRIAGTRRWRNFDTRAQYSSAGRELAGTHLKIAEREFEARADVTWDQAASWQTMTRVTALDYRDNGSGYFNYGEHKLGQEVEWKEGDWLVRAMGSAGRVKFHVQTVGFGIDPPARVEDEFAVELRVERRVARAWTVFAEYNWTRTRSNDPIASYVVNEGLLGLRWSWEK
jgi:hypothetical protein